MAVNKAYGEASRLLDNRIADLYDSGAKCADIARKLGVSRHTVERRISKMRKTGQVKPLDMFRAGPNPRARIARLSSHFGRSLGHMSQAMAGLTDAQLAWLYTSTPEGMTVAQNVAAMIRDAYHEENGDDR